MKFDILLLQHQWSESESTKGFAVAAAKTDQQRSVHQDQQGFCPHAADC